FENYIVGKSNELAHAACRAVAERPGIVYNPLFLYGGVGLGKTHLVQAVGHEILKNDPATKIIYVSCEKFTNDYIDAVKNGRGKEFQDRYRNVDILLIDDIQFITGKERTQEAFFHTFNALHQNNKQIVLTSDRPPKAIATLEKRLLSRFEWGMIADIQNPDLETRIAILEAKCQEKDYSLDSEIINYLASNIQTNIRELEGALNRIIAQHQLQNIEPSLPNVKKLISKIASTFQNRSLTPKQILEIVADFYDIDIALVVGNSRKKELVVPRQITMFLMREELRSSYPMIGNELGGRDHTTAMHACDKITKAFENDEKLRQEILSIKQRIYNS
ncbi:MAG TPA: chromosomal replication initiator protein DnaA, partial [Patescibacteria group bacterium]